MDLCDYCIKHCFNNKYQSAQFIKTTRIPIPNCPKGTGNCVIKRFMCSPISLSSARRVPLVRFDDDEDIMCDRTLNRRQTTDANQKGDRIETERLVSDNPWQCADGLRGLTPLLFFFNLFGKNLFRPSRLVFLLSVQRSFG